MWAANGNRFFHLLLRICREFGVRYSFSDVVLEGSSIRVDHLRAKRAKQYIEYQRTLTGKDLEKHQRKCKQWDLCRHFRRYKELNKVHRYLQLVNPGVFTLPFVKQLQNHPNISHNIPNDVLARPDEENSRGLTPEEIFRAVRYFNLTEEARERHRMFHEHFQGDDTVGTTLLQRFVQDFLKETAFQTDIGPLPANILHDDEALGTIRRRMFALYDFVNDPRQHDAKRLEAFAEILRDWKEHHTSSVYDTVLKKLLHSWNE